MPSLQQINRNTEKKVAKQPKESPIGSIIFLLICALLGFGAYKYYTMPKIDKIPEKTYKTAKGTKFNDLFKSDIKKIVWFGLMNEGNSRRKENINYSLKYEKLDKIYQQRAYLESTLYFKCKESGCIEKYLSDRCVYEICILIPKTREIVTVPYEKLFDKLDELRDK
ncbi:MAG: hypothetical protein J6Y53_02865 [Alphaproteobacteria bacterium]|nr:hypothetical protein [Alphaproteobacteria bacterium]